MIRTVAAVLLTASAAIANTPPELSGSGLAPVGTERISVLGFSMFDITLHTRAGSPFSFGTDFAITLEYTRGFSEETLVSSTIGEMSRITGKPRAVFQPLAAPLADCFRDVGRGDRFTAVSETDDIASLYFNGGRTCRISWPNFRQEFFGIWLGPRARDQGALARLTGG